MKLRAVVVKFAGADGRRCSVSTDRYGHNAPRGYATDEQLQRQAMSNALAGVVQDARYGADWASAATITTVEVPMHH